MSVHGVYVRWSMIRLFAYALYLPFLLSLRLQQIYDMIARIKMSKKEQKNHMIHYAILYWPFTTTQIDNADKIKFFRKMAKTFHSASFLLSRSATLFNFYYWLGETSAFWFSSPVCFILIRIIMDDVIHMTIAVQVFLDHSTTYTSHYHFPPKRVSCFSLAFL